MPGNSFERGGIKYSVGDCVLLESEESLPYVARINSILNGKNGNCKLKVAWFYRPDDPAIPGGRKKFHGERELYASDHVDEVYSASIVGKCTVHSVADYQELTEVSPTDYYTRFTYKVLSKEFLPPTVTVHCVCQLPENPDLDMMECDGCKEWFHPECLKLTLQEAANISPFFCPHCTQHQLVSQQLHEQSQADTHFAGDPL